MTPDYCGTRLNEDEYPASQRERSFLLSRNFIPRWQLRQDDKFAREEMSQIWPDWTTRFPSARIQGVDS